ncbi:MAG: hypothetical protein K6G69_10820 [Lachnospiraceae bacterium]|nr:hypothetical protein [Lachnospiraceae bacterium]
MYDIREELMYKMVKELKEEQPHFEIMTDEEYYYSDYGITRRKRNQTCSNVVYMHCLVPGVAKNLFGAYFHKKDIAIAVPMDFETFTTDLNVERKVEDVFKKPYISFKVIRKDYDEMYEDGKKLISDLLAFADKNNFRNKW